MTEELLLEWIRKAEEDYEVAMSLARKRKRPVPNSVCFHAQQCAEKYLKAFLIKQGIPFRKIHDLLELREECCRIDTSFVLLDEFLHRLNRYAVVFRYPGEEATVEEAKSAVEAMKAVREFIRRKLGLMK